MERVALTSHASSQALCHDADEGKLNMNGIFGYEHIYFFFSDLDSDMNITRCIR